MNKSGREFASWIKVRVVKTSAYNTLALFGLPRPLQRIRWISSSQAGVTKSKYRWLWRSRSYNCQPAMESESVYSGAFPLNVLVPWLLECVGAPRCARQHSRSLNVRVHCELFTCTSSTGATVCASWINLCTAWKTRWGSQSLAPRHRSTTRPQ